MLERVIERVKKAKLVKHVVVASPHELPCSVPLFIGDEKDVLRRYYDCASFYSADIIVRVTADCPLIDPEVIDYAISYFKKHLFPYVYIAPVDGLDVEVFTIQMLEEAYLYGNSKEDREHVTPYMKRKTKCSGETRFDLKNVRRLWTGKAR